MSAKCERCGGDHRVRWCEDDTLTFAEAMALDPSEVEVRWRDDQQWMLVSSIKAEWPLQKWREATFRRSRPKRSRVEEMADAKWPVENCQPRGAHRIDLEARTEAIPAVCEYVRKHREQTGTLLDESHIERRFLEPR